jgi:hypothetical protein
MKNFVFYIRILIFVLVFVSAVKIAVAENINVFLAQVANPNPIGIINQFYQFALLISGLLAFGAIVYGGIKYILAAGNPSGQTEGREWIKSALLGLLLLLGAYLVLNTINPNLTKLSLPGLTPIQAQNPAGLERRCTSGLCPGKICVQDSSVSAGYRCESAITPPPGKMSCGGTMCDIDKCTITINPTDPTKSQQTCKP